MSMPLRRDKAVVWLAVMAVLMHAFWPVAGQLRAATPAMVQVICSVHGTMFVPAEDEAPARDEVKPSCAMCSAVGFAIASDSPGPNAVQDAPGSALPQLNTSAPSQRALHSLPSPRAPPQAS